MYTNDPWPTGDPLREALHFLSMSGAFYCRSELTAPWGLALPAMPDCLWFHQVLSGGGWLVVDGADPLYLHPGDIALVPHGKGHSLRSAPEVAAPSIHVLAREPLSARYEILRHGGQGGEETLLICGGMSFDHPATRHLVALLPDVIHFAWSESARLEALQSTIRLLAAEAKDLRPGGELVIARLADILVLQAIRAWMATAPAARTGWLGAIQDPQIGQALTHIHRDPARAWTIAALAREVAMSRSAFAARFTALVNEPVQRYIARWRMQVALASMREEDLSIAALARRLGYQSEAAFSRAFKRQFGVSPGAVRRDKGPSRQHPSISPSVR